MSNPAFILLALFGVISIGYSQEPACGHDRIPALRQGSPGAPTTEIYGTVSAIHGTQMILTTRDGRQVNINAKALADSPRMTPGNVDLPVMVLGTYGSHGTLVAQIINRAKPGRNSWPPDCSVTNASRGQK
jgi:hypothetical protein